MTRPLQQPDSNRTTQIVRVLPRRSDSNRAIRIVRALWPIHSPAEKVNRVKVKAARDNPAGPGKASRPREEAQQPTPVRPRANNQDRSRATAGNLAADVPDHSKPTARNPAAVVVRAGSEIIRPAEAEAKDQQTNGAEPIRPGR